MAVNVNQVRPAALAGSFYPADPGALARMVEDYLDQAQPYHVAPKALIAPHAGFIYSGAIAGTSYKSIAARRDTIRRVVLLGPCHRVPVRAFAVPSAEAFATPLGIVPIDRPTVDRLAKSEVVEVSDAAHAEEHSLETQLPFLQRALGDFLIVPVLVGAAPREQVSRLLRAVWGGPETLVVISSDLSHFLDYEAARGLDIAACRSVEALDPDQLNEEQACGRHAIRGLLAQARDRDLRATTLDLRNSGDTAGRNHRERVVGYGSIAFENAATARLSDSDRAQLLRSAAQSLASGLRKGKTPYVAVESFPRALQAVRASFVTLKVDGDLRGCVGSVKAHRPLIEDVANASCKAALSDHRFRPLTPEELQSYGNGLDLSVSILSHPRPIAFGSEVEAIQALNPWEDGVILRCKNHSGLFLPQVWDTVPRPEKFLATLKRKAGLAEDFWSDDLQLYRFRCETFGSNVKLQ